jgi:hypothetical protein
VRQFIVNENTGEVVFEGEYVIKKSIEKNSGETSKKMVDEMLLKVVHPKEIDLGILWNWCKATRILNKYNQISLLGSYLDNDTKDKMLQDITITGYSMRIFNMAHNFSCVIMKNRKTAIKSWSELFEEISCGNKAVQKKLKNFFNTNKLIRDIVVVDRNGDKVKKLVLNPFLVRGASYGSQLAIMLFQDFIKEGVNIPVYAVRLLQGLGHIDSLTQNVSDESFIE